MMSMGGLGEGWQNSTPGDLKMGVLRPLDFVSGGEELQACHTV